MVFILSFKGLIPLTCDNQKWGRFFSSFPFFAGFNLHPPNYVCLFIIFFFILFGFFFRLGLPPANCRNLSPRTMRLCRLAYVGPFNSVNWTIYETYWPYYSIHRCLLLSFSLLLNITLCRQGDIGYLDKAKRAKTIFSQIKVELHEQKHKQCAQKEL